MWAKVESGSVTKIYTSPKRLTIGDVQYPSNIFQLWSDSELKAIGIYSVVQDNSNFKDVEYYINGNESFSFASDTKIKIGLLVPLTGENKNLGQSIIKSTRMALNDLGKTKIEIYPKDTGLNPNKTLQAAKELKSLGVKIFIGPVFFKNLIYFF